MQPSQPILRRSRRINPVDPGLSHFVDVRKDSPATEKQSPEATAPERTPLPAPAIDMPEPLRQLHQPAPSAAHIGPAVDSPLDTNGENAQTEDVSELSNHLPETHEESSASPPAHYDSTFLAGPTPDRRSHNPITYKRRRTLRIRPIPKGSDMPHSTQQSSCASTPASTPSCSPVPVKSRKRRRRLPPLKNRLAKVARARLARLKSQETLSQPSVSAFLDPEDDYVPPMVEPNVVQRRLVAPQNYTIPDLKDLLNSKSQAHVDQAVKPVEPQRNSLPQFILPPIDGVHTLRLRSELKPVRTRRRDVGPRLNFVPLEAHQEQATARPSERRLNAVVGTQALPLVEQPSPRKVQTYGGYVAPPAATTSPARVCFANNTSPSRSPYRILVKSTPEPEEPTFSTPQHIPEGSHRAQAPAHRIHPLDSTSSRRFETAPTRSTQPRFTPPPSRALAPMSDLLDNLMKLARSAVEMERPVSPSPMRPSLKRARQTTLTRNGSIAHLVFESAEPSKVRKLD